MNTMKTSIRDQAARVRIAMPGYRILRRIVTLQRAGAGGARRAGGDYPVASQNYPLAAE